MKTLKILFAGLFVTFLMFSCEHERMNTTDFENPPHEGIVEITNSVKEKINNAQPLPVKESRFQEECVFPVGPNCIQINESVVLSLDISGCSTNVTTPCDVFADMTMTICVDPITQDVEVNFEEYTYGHAASCITDPSNHSDDWECLSNLVYNAYQQMMMPIILQLYPTDNDCLTGRSTVVSNYVQEVCVYPCTEMWGDFYVSRLVQCGESTACCIETTSWCVDSNGVAVGTPGGKTTYGSCTPAALPCKVSKGDPPSSTWLSCQPRSCR